MSSTKKKVLVTGGAGLLASSAWLEMQDRWDLTLVVRSMEKAPSGIKTLACALEEEAKVRSILKSNRPDLVIHAAGMTSVEECEKNKYQAHTLNVLVSRIMARETKRQGIRLIHISTDHFASETKQSDEQEIGFPQNTYALTKLQGEYEVLSAHDSAIIARTNFFSWGLPHRKTFFDNIVNNLREGHSVTVFSDVIFNPLSGAQLLDYLDQLDTAGVKGVFNVVGDEVLSKHNFGLKVAEAFKLDKKFLQTGKLSDAKTLVKRPFNLGLSNSKMKKALSIQATPSMSDMLSNLAQLENNHKDRIQAAFSNNSSKFISYGRQSILDQDYESVIAALGNPYLTQGPKVEEFENRLAEMVGAKYAVAMCNWTAGLHMAVLAAGVGPGDNVITSPITFVASSNCAIYAGANPHFADIDPDTLNICPERVEELCRKLGKVKAIIPVHFGGAPCDMKKLKEIADRYGAVLIEDAAHAVGGSYLSGEKTGNPLYSKMVGFSFHPVKNVTTGEGGLITTNDEDVYRHLLRLRSHGISKGSDPFLNQEQAYTDGKINPWYYEMQEIGFNYRITDLQCALGLSQISRLEGMHSNRVAIANQYDKAFGGQKHITLKQNKTRKQSGNHLYVLSVDYKALGVSRIEVMNKLRERHIGSHVHYIPVYRQPFYQQNYPVDLSHFPNTEAYYQSALTLPMYSSMTQDEVQRVIDSVLEVIK